MVLGLLAALLCCVLTGTRALAQGFSAFPGGFASDSGQFFVRLMPPPLERSPLLPGFEADPHFIQLDPMLLPVSCERIKQSLWTELGNKSAWRSRIYIRLHPASSGEDPVTITSDRFSDGWQYQVDLPNLIERTRYVRAIVRVLLLEFANRNAGERPAEIPYWLTEGLSQQLLAATNNELAIILPPPNVGPGGLRVTELQVNARLADPLQHAHQILCAAAPLTFQQLSWPALEQLTTDSSGVYRSSAQLFVADLLELPDGPPCLLAMLAELPAHYNWQLAFLHAFRSHFSRTLDVEKWWALQVVYFTGRELAQTWTPAESWHKLDETLGSTVDVRLQANALPMQTDVKLQTIIQQWDAARQTQALQGKLRDLNALRLRLAPTLVPLLDQYRLTLETYLREREHHGLLLGLGRKATLRRASLTALAQLNALDATRNALRPADRPGAMAQAGN